MSFKNFDFSMFDSEAGFQIGEAKAPNNDAVAMGQCSFSGDCSGGGGQCGFNWSCGGGGGMCSKSLDCGGS